AVTRPWRCSEARSGDLVATRTAPSRTITPSPDLPARPGNPSGRRVPSLLLQVQVSIEVQVIGAIEEQIAGVSRRGPGCRPVHDPGGRAALHHEFRTEPARPVAARRADEPGLERAPAAERGQLAEPSRQGEGLALLGAGERRQAGRLLERERNPAPADPY